MLMLDTGTRCGGMFSTMCRNLQPSENCSLVPMLPLANNYCVTFELHSHVKKTGFKGHTIIVCRGAWKQGKEIEQR